MNPDREKFLSLRTNPARLSAEETAWCLGFSQHEIPVLVSKGLLKPLGHPVPNTVKYFAATTVEEMRRDVKWLSRATDAVMEYWRMKNAQKRDSRGGVRLPSETTGRLDAVDRR